MPRIRMALGLLLDERELDAQRDVVGEHVAAGGQRHVPVHVELGTVDDGLEVQVAARVAEGVGGGLDPGAGGGDGAGYFLDRQLAVDLGGAVVLYLRGGGAGVEGSGGG